MARTKQQNSELTPDVTLNPELESTQNLMAVVSGQMNDERDLLNQLLGQAQMADAFEQFSRTVRTS
ncbi:hypothetical protein IHE72_26675, partial [Klebsiella pneumoniae]|nr:hypothetical protein [Klebsiella pneumoniae]